MKLTKADIIEITTAMKEEQTKSNKLRLVAAFVQVAAPKVGLKLEGDIVADLMQWADDAHLEECEICGAFEDMDMGDVDDLFSGSPDA